MHGYTNYEQSKALFEHGYRHPDNILEVDKWDSYYLTTMPIDIQVEVFPSFSLADLVTMRGSFRLNENNVNEMIDETCKDLLCYNKDRVELINQRLNQAYAN
jgi:hypothetical protein